MPPVDPGRPSENTGRAASDRPASRRLGRRFFAWLALIAFLALAGRVVYVVTVTHDDPNIYDATYYELQAREITHGQGFFKDPFLLFSDHPEDQPAADHPPLTVFALLPAAFVEGPRASQYAMRFTMALIGTATVVLIGLLARQLGGDIVGLAAAVLAAVDPNLWMNDGLIMSEALSALLTVGLIMAAYGVIRRGVSWPRAVLLGVLAALGILARAEFVLYVPFLVLPALWIGARRNGQHDGPRDHRADLRRAGGMAAIAVGVTLVVLAPWVAFNMSRFQEPTLISTNDGLALRAANCDVTFYGSRIGSVNVFPPCAQARDDREQSVWNAANRSDALHYMVDHVDRIPVVALTRVGRVLNVFNLRQSAFLAAYEGHPKWGTYIGAVLTWITVPLAVFGAVVMRRRRLAIWPLVVPVAITTIAIALWAGGLLRYRAPAEPSIVILAVFGGVGLVQQRRRRATSGTAPAETPAASTERAPA
jgi:4-amino-4-deoxy-L-arabinose transferase-like glycosyltransferase